MDVAEMSAGAGTICASPLKLTTESLPKPIPVSVRGVSELPRGMLLGFSRVSDTEAEPDELRGFGGLTVVKSAELSAVSGLPAMRMTGLGEFGSPGGLA